MMIWIVASHSTAQRRVAMPLDATGRCGILYDVVNGCSILTESTEGGAFL